MAPNTDTTTINTSNTSTTYYSTTTTTRQTRSHAAYMVDEFIWEIISRNAIDHKNTANHSNQSTHILNATRKFNRRNRDYLLLSYTDTLFNTADMKECLVGRTIEHWIRYIVFSNVTLVRIMSKIRGVKAFLRNATNCSVNVDELRFLSNRLYSDRLMPLKLEENRRVNLIEILIYFEWSEAWAIYLSNTK